MYAVVLIPSLGQQRSFEKLACFVLFAVAIATNKTLRSHPPAECLASPDNQLAAFPHPRPSTT